MLETADRETKAEHSITRHTFVDQLSNSRQFRSPRVLHAACKARYSHGCIELLLWSHFSLPVLPLVLCTVSPSSSVAGTWTAGKATASLLRLQIDTALGFAHLNRRLLEEDEGIVVVLTAHTLDSTHCQGAYLLHCLSKPRLGCKSA